MNSRDYYYNKVDMTATFARIAFNSIHELRQKSYKKEEISTKEIVNALDDIDRTLEELFNLVLALERKVSEKND